MVLLVVYYNLTYVQAQGRYLFPALPALACLAALGWSRLFPARLRVVGTLACAAALAPLSWVALLRFVVPFFRA
jgi:hypothetical protein